MSRTYRGTAQAEVAALNSGRIIEAALALFEERWIDQIALEHVAQRARVTVPTILRHFGSKEGLFAAAGRLANDTATGQRAEAPAGDLEGAVDNLVEHYELAGDRVIKLLAQEGHYPQLHELLEEGRAKHREWVERVLGPYIAQRPDHERARLRAELVALCDVQTWKLLRRDSGLSRDETRLALLEMLSRVIGLPG